MASAGSIFVDLLLNDAQFRDALKKSKGHTKDFGSVIVAASSAAATAVAVLAGALAGLTVHQMHVIDATTKAARSLGISTREFQSLSLVAAEAGVGQEDLAALIGKSQKSIYEAAKSGSKAFQSLGLDVKALINLKPDQQFEAIAEKLSNIENPTIRTAKAMEIFGRNGRAVIDMLADFKEKSDEARAFNDKFNISVSEIDARKVEEANDSFARIGKAIGGLGNTIAIQVSPLITAFSKEILDAGVNGKTFGIFVANGMKGAALAIDGVRLAALGIKATFLEVEISIAKLTLDGIRHLYEFAEAAKNVPGMHDVMQGASDGLKNSWNGLATAALITKKNLDGLKAGAGDFKTTSEIIAGIQKEADGRAARAVKGRSFKGGIDPLAIEEMDAALQRQKGLLKSIVGPGLELKQTLADLEILYKSGELTAGQYADALDKIKLQMAELDKSASGGFAAGMIKVSQQLKDVGNLAETFVTDAFKNAEDALVSWATTGKLNTRGLIDSMISDFARLQIRQIEAPLFGAISSGASSIFGSIFSSLPHFAKGGFLGPGQWGVAGENGPEPIYGGSSGLSVIPHGAGGGVQVNITNNAPVQVSARSGRDGNGKQSIEIMIDEMMAQKLSDPGSKAARALGTTFGMSPQLAGR